MSARNRLIYMVALTALSVVLALYTEGWAGLPSGDKSVWFHSGLLMLIIGSFWIEHFFTKPADVFVNGLLVYVSTSMLVFTEYIELWTLMQYLSLALATSACWLVWVSGEKTREISSSLRARLFYKIVTRVGSSKSLFTAVLALSVVTYFRDEGATGVMIVAVWGLAVFFKEVDPLGIWDYAFGSKALWGGERLGQVSRYYEPGIVRFDLNKGQSCDIGTMVLVSSKDPDAQNDPVAVSVGSRKSLSGMECEAIVIDGSLSDNQIDTNIYIYKFTNEDDQIGRAHV